MPEQCVIGPASEDDYRHFVIPYWFKHDRFVKAIDVRPEDRNVLHLFIAQVDTSGTARSAVNTHGCEIAIGSRKTEEAWTAFAVEWTGKPDLAPERIWLRCE